MSFSAVQGSNNSGGTSATTTKSLTFNSATTAGNLLIAAFVFEGALPTISAPSGWSLAVSFDTGSGISAAMYYQQNAPSQTTTGNFTFSPNAGSTFRITGEEYGGFGATVNVDQTNHNSGASTTVSSGSITTTKAPSACLALLCSLQTGVPSGLTNSYVFDNNSTGSGAEVGIARLFQNSTGSTSVSGTISSATWVGVIANLYSPVTDDESEMMQSRICCHEISRTYSFAPRRRR